MAPVGWILDLVGGASPAPCCRACPHPSLCRPATAHPVRLLAPAVPLLPAGCSPLPARKTAPRLPARPCRPRLHPCLRRPSSCSPLPSGCSARQLAASPAAARLTPDAAPELCPTGDVLRERRGGRGWGMRALLMEPNTGSQGAPAQVSGFATGSGFAITRRLFVCSSARSSVEEAMCGASRGAGAPACSTPAGGCRGRQVPAQRTRFRLSHIREREFPVPLAREMGEPPPWPPPWPSWCPLGPPPSSRVPSR